MLLSCNVSCNSTLQQIKLMESTSRNQFTTSLDSMFLQIQTAYLFSVVSVASIPRLNPITVWYAKMLLIVLMGVRPTTNILMSNSNVYSGLFRRYQLEFRWKYISGLTSDTILKYTFSINLELLLS